MARLSPALKNLINAPFARPNVVPAPRRIAAVYEDIAHDARSKGVDVRAWISIAAGTTITLNSSDAFRQIYTTAATHWDALMTAELMREVGLKSIGCHGIPKTINTLTAFATSLPDDTKARLHTSPTRHAISTQDMMQQGTRLWTSIYTPHDKKLLSKLADAHPDLPVPVLREYGALFCDAEDDSRAHDIRVGRVLMSLVAIACLRAQGGAGPQVLSHVYGLRKAEQRECEVGGGEWLGGDEGCAWVLGSVDRIVDAFRSDEVPAKL